jgi:outer membrane lipoprotein carrier protein
LHPSRLLIAAACSLGLALVAGSSSEVRAADGPASVDDLVQALQGRYEGISTLQAKFTQVITSMAMGEVKSKGKVVVAKPRKARWETSGANASLFVTDGTKMSIYTPASKQVIEMNDMSRAGGGNVDIMALLQDISKLDEQFAVTLQPAAPASDGPIVVDAVPRKPGGYTNVRLEFDRKSYDLTRVVFTDSMGGTTDLQFSDLKLDAKVADDAFQFTAPDGVTVIDGGAM